MKKHDGKGGDAKKRQNSVEVVRATEFHPNYDGFIQSSSTFFNIRLIMLAM